MSESDLSSTTPEFVHLHLHTEYSLVDGLIRIKPLMQRTAELGMAATALTDQSNLFAMVKFYRAAMANGVKPLFGVDIILADDNDQTRESRLLLLCQNNQGYLNVTELISLSYQKGQSHGKPRIEKSWLAEHSEGLIVLSGGVQGELGQLLATRNEAELAQSLSFWKQHFPNRFYIELQRTHREGEQAYIEAAVNLAIRENLPVVATNDVCFTHASDFDAHEARVCIHDGYTLNDPRRPHKYNKEQYLKSPAEMAELFADLPEALQNTVEIARRCNVTLNLGHPVLPDFPIPEGLNEEQFITLESEKGLKARLDVILPPETEDREAKVAAYEERLNIELGVINQMGFPGYFLIVADFIQWAKDNDIPVGPGRGSGAGSLVAYALKITDLDPLEYDLLFERFLNPERVSMPDFDVDFCMDKRDLVIDYVARHYGRDKVSQIITYGSMAAKAVIRDVGRVLGHPYGFVDRIAKLIPFEIGITLDKALAQEEELAKLYQNDEEVTALLDLAKKLEGIARNAGKHAGGVVIAPTKLTDFSPLYCEPSGENLVTQFDKDDVEAIGLVKFDFLGLRTLTIIDWAVKAVNRYSDETLDISRIPLDDERSFELLKAQQTTAVFQLESRGMKELIKRLQPGVFEDIIALVALYRPGPLQSGMVDDFINRKHGRAEVEYPHPDLEPILEPTYGVILYQEQVMQIAQVLANYSLGGADLLRRAMGKKKAEEMAKQREIFLKGSAERGVDESVANYIFDLMEKFAGYGFNKSHSAAYALLSYQTAWLKAHHPAAFMSSVLSADMDNTDKIVTLIDECRDMKLEVLPPDVNTSQYRFEATQNGTILYGLGAIKGVGEGAIESLILERKRGGPYQSLDEFCRRINSQKTTRRVLEALIRAGALDQLGSPEPNRASLMSWLPGSLLRAEQYRRDSESGQADLFGGPIAIAEEETLELIPEWSEAERLRYEKENLGLYLTGHPILEYLDELKMFTSARISALDYDAVPTESEGANRFVRNHKNEKEVVIAGLIIEIRTRNGRSGRMAFVTLDDRSARIEVALFGDDFEKFGHLLVKDKILVVIGGLGYDDFSGQYRLRAKEVFDIDHARARFARYLEVRLDSQQICSSEEGTLQNLMEPYLQGSCPVVIQYQNKDAQASIRLGEAWHITPTDECLERLGGLTGESGVRVCYS